MTPAAAARPKALPPVSRMAWIRSTRESGRSKSVSRVPGAGPRTSTQATAPSGGNSTTVQPVIPTGSPAWPTCTPGTWVMPPPRPRPPDRPRGSRSAGDVVASVIFGLLLPQPAGAGHGLHPLVVDGRQQSGQGTAIGQAVAGHHFL